MDRPKSLTELGLTARGGLTVDERRSTLGRLRSARDRRMLVTGLTVDSRAVKEGYLFAALPGAMMHGAEFIGPALRMGAAAILTDAEGAKIAAEFLAGADVALIIAEDQREALAGAAALWFGAQPDCMVAVTGTNGKTSVATFARQIWMQMGHAAINIGTTGVEGAWTAPSAHTTPDPITLHRMLATAAAEGVTHAAMEASSHGLDYHKTFDAYFAAKAALFDRVLPEDGVAVINMNDPKGAAMASIAVARGQNLITVGHAADCDLRILAQRFDATGQDVRLAWRGTPYQVRLNLIGGFQAENVALAAGLVLGAGEAASDVTPPARRGWRPRVRARLIGVLGAGGARARTKRPLGGAPPRANADVLYVTD